MDENLNEFDYNNFLNVSAPSVGQLWQIKSCHVLIKCSLLWPLGYFIIIFSRLPSSLQTQESIVKLKLCLKMTKNLQIYKNLQDYQRTQSTLNAINNKIWIIKALASQIKI